MPSKQTKEQRIIVNIIIHNPIDTKLHCVQRKKVNKKNPKRNNKVNLQPTEQALQITANNDRGLQIDLNQLKNHPLRVMYAVGDKQTSETNEQIEWEEPTEGIITYSRMSNYMLEPGIKLPSPHGGWGYAGFDSTTGIYWRHQDECDSGKGEYCMRILRILSED